MDPPRRSVRATQGHTVTAPAEEPRYTGAQAARIVGASYRQIDYWLTERIITTTHDPHPSSGYTRLLTIDELTQLRIIVVCVDVFTLEAARHIIDRVNTAMDTAVVTTGPLRIVIDVAACRQHVLEKAATMRPRKTGRRPLPPIEVGAG